MRELEGFTMSIRFPQVDAQFWAKLVMAALFAASMGCFGLAAIG